MKTENVKSKHRAELVGGPLDGLKIDAPDDSVTQLAIPWSVKCEGDARLAVIGNTEHYQGTANYNRQIVDGADKFFHRNLRR